MQIASFYLILPHPNFAFLAVLNKYYHRMVRTVPLPADLLPLDFGIENLDCPVHGNIVVNLKENETMRVNSMILALHSPVFQDMFYNLGLVSVDMDDFTAENVREFFRALYSGRLELSKDNFRNMNKIATAFKSKWLISKCTIFFYEELNQSIQVLEQENRIGDLIWTLEWLFNESLFVKKNTKNEDLLEFVAEKFSHLTENVLQAFVGTVLLDFNSVCLDKLHWLIRITDKHMTILAEVLKENLRLLEKGGLDENTRYLLENIDFVRCYKVDPILYYEEVFDILFRNLDKLERKDVDMVIQLSRKTSKEAYSSTDKNAAKDEQSYQNEGPGEKSDLVLDIFSEHNLDNLAKIENDETYKTELDRLGNMTELKNMYMLFEALFKVEEYCGDNFNRSIIENLVMLKARRGFSCVQPEFIRDLASYYTYGPLNELMNCEELVSRKSCRRISSNLSYRIKDFFTMETYHHFGFLHQDAEHRCESCDYSGLFGFILKVCPSTHENPDSFNIQLVADVEKGLLEGGIGQGFCHHHDLVKHDRIHITFETIYIYTLDSFKEHYFNFKSWDKRPNVLDGRFLWGKDEFSADDMIRLIVHLELQS